MALLPVGKYLWLRERVCGFILIIHLDVLTFIVLTHWVNDSSSFPFSSPPLSGLLAVVLFCPQTYFVEY